MAHARFNCTKFINIAQVKRLYKFKMDGLIYYFQLKINVLIYLGPTRLSFSSKCSLPVVKKMGRKWECQVVDQVVDQQA